MTSAPPASAPSAFSWNAGGWFGAVFGCTIWMLILGFVLLSKDVPAAAACMAGFLVLAAWGFFLWRSSGRVGAYAGLQRFLLGVTVVFAAVVVVANARGVSDPPRPGALVSTWLPYWVIAVGPALMLLFSWRERSVRRSPPSPSTPAR